MTEIPEHLLKRSRERRAALGLGGDTPAEGGDSAPAASVPATTSAPAAPAAPSGPPERAAAPVPAEPEPPKPDIPVVAAYKARKKIPFWAMTALALLPLWAVMYARSVTTQAQEATGPLAAGAAVYGNCASCHGGDGQGQAGNGYQFSEGEVLATFPNIEDQLRFVYWGSDNYSLAGIDVYGDPDRDGGPHVTGERGVMPAQGADAGGALTDYEVLGVVCHERFTLGGASDDESFDDEYETWCSEESEIFHELEGGESLLTIHELHDSVMPIGDPAPGQPAQE